MISDVEGMFNQMMQTGWSGMEPDPEAMKAQQLAYQQAMLTEAGVCDAFISTPEGQRFLAWLAKATILRGPSDAERAARTIEEYVLAKRERDGQNGLFFMILRAVQAAHDAKSGVRNEDPV